MYGNNTCASAVKISGVRGSYALVPLYKFDSYKSYCILASYCAQIFIQVSVSMTCINRNILFSWLMYRNLILSRI
jgi:hypothetical protein